MLGTNNTFHYVVTKLALLAREEPAVDLLVEWLSSKLGTVFTHLFDGVPAFSASL
jgi:hypothetical protein